MDEQPCSKKIKLDQDDYSKCTKEELIEIISQLKCQLQTEKVSHQSKKELDKKPRTYDFSKCMFRRVAFKLLYLGWNYDGYVTQATSNNTIEHHLIQALTRTCLIEDLSKSSYHRCGRTDLGVSAFSQVISLTVRSCLKENETNDQELPYCKMLNAVLPKDIRIIAWVPVTEDFSARFNCKKRLYKYWFPYGNLDLEKMNEAAKYLVGWHDFRNLCNMDVKNGVINFTRNIFKAEISVFPNKLCVNDSSNANYGMAEFTVEAGGFLWHQIRAIVAILLLVGQRKEEANIINELLDVKKHPRKPQYCLASPLPLNLYGCEFEDVEWILEDKNLKHVRSDLQIYWARLAVKCCMIENMLKDLRSLGKEAEDDNIYNDLLIDIKCRNYKPLLSRPVGETLESKIEHYVKRGRLKLRENKQNQTK